METKLRPLETVHKTTNVWTDTLADTAKQRHKWRGSQLTPSTEK
jgi:hypothetical protein